jgi:hypothetical protein
MKNIFLFLGLGLLSFSVACGSGGGSNTSFGGGGGGSNANSQLSGQYTYQLTGIDLVAGAFFREAGVFTADGNGKITAGLDDSSENSSVALGIATTGSYSISSNGTGSAVLNFANNGVLTLAFTVISPSKIDLIEVDPGVTGGGTAELQTASAFSAAPSGTFVYRVHTFDVGEVGAITVSSGAFSGNADVNDGGAVSSVAPTGAFNFPDATSGRGTGTLTDSVTGTTTFAYYVIDANTVSLFTTTPGVLGLGRAEKQSTSSFTAASLSGGYAFGSRGDTPTNGDGVRTVGQFNANGSGVITAGAYDSVQDGNSTSDATFTSGSYTMASNGRAQLTFTATTGTIQDIYWMVSPSRAFFLVDDSGKVEDGTADLQQSSSFSNSSVSGNYGFVTDGYLPATGDTYDRVGLLTPDGSGNIGFEYILNLDGTASSTPVTLHGTYSVAGNGRMTGSASSLSSNLVFYLVSGSQAYFLQNDSGVEIDGSMSKLQ